MENSPMLSNDEAKKALIDRFWFFVQENSKRDNLTLEEALNKAINEQCELWEECKKVIIGRWNDGKTREI